MKQIELLAPAKDLDTGLAAIRSGADAVYIGGPRFGARVNAGNTVADIARLAHEAHFYNARVYAALNTILTDAELDQAQGLITGLYEAGVDALIIQDMGILELSLPPIPLFASTQAHNHTPARVKFLEDVGFSRVILARELSLSEIKEIRRAVNVELEAFVHGAICVGYSGRCYLSHAMTGRSGNRGECGQPCRLEYDLETADGKKVWEKRYLLSPRDMNLSERLPELLAAGVTSFKIEGRLKDKGYIKNITAFYRQKLDAAMEGKGYKRASSGTSLWHFTPHPAKSFNRGFTTHFIDGRAPGGMSFFTQKSIGEPLGTVSRVEKDFFVMKNPVDLVPGDGICFFDARGVLGGMFIKGVEGTRIFPQDIRFIQEGLFLYRNQDNRFEKEIMNDREERVIGVRLTLSNDSNGLVLEGADEDGHTAAVQAPMRLDVSMKPGEAMETLHKQLSRLGGTPYRALSITIKTDAAYFVPVSAINALRRDWCARLTELRAASYKRIVASVRPNSAPFPEQNLDFTANIHNSRAAAFYRRHGVTQMEGSAEGGVKYNGRPVMTTRHCLRYHAGLCLKYPVKPSLPLAHKPSQGETLYLRQAKRRFKLAFLCDRCEMEVSEE